MKHKIGFILSDQATRFEKTKMLAEYEVSQKYLDVCFRFNNCGNCQKCYRTLVTLDLMDALDKYSECFDIDMFRKNRDKAYYWLIKTQNPNSVSDNAVFANELYRIAKNKKMIPFKSRFKYFFTRPALAAENFIMHKLLPKSAYKKIFMKKHNR